MTSQGDKPQSGCGTGGAGLTREQCIEWLEKRMEGQQTEPVKRYEMHSAILGFLRTPPTGKCETCGGKRRVVEPGHAGYPDGTPSTVPCPDCQPGGKAAKPTPSAGITESEREALAYGAHCIERMPWTDGSEAAATLRALCAKLGGDK